MAAKLLDRVKMSVVGAPGTGSITLGSAAVKYQSITGAGGSNGDTISYLIDDGVSWETGVGTYNSGVLSRDTVLASSAAGSKISATAEAIVYATVLASDLQSGTSANQLVRLNGSSKLPAVDGSLLTNLAAAAITGTLPVANGGTGLTSLTAGYIPFGNGTDALGSSANLICNGVSLTMPKALVSGTGASTEDCTFELGGNRTGSGNAYIDIHATAGSDFESRILRYGGADGTLSIQNSGTGGISIYQQGAAAVTFGTNNSERMRIDSAGNVGIGATTVNGTTLNIAKTITGGVFGRSIQSQGQIQSDVTTNYYNFTSYPSVVDAAFTLPELSHFVATQGTKGASATITTQIGFNVASNLTGATNNYGFYSNIASGTGRWNFYAGGTADNYFAGNVGIGTNSPANKLSVLNTSAGGIAYFAYNGSTGGGSVLKVANGYSSTVPIYAFWYNDTTGIGNPSAGVINFISAGSETMRITSSGNVGIGTSSPGYKFSVGNGVIQTTSSDGSSDARLDFTMKNGTDYPNAWIGIPSWDKTTLHFYGPTATTSESIATYGTAIWAFKTGGTERLRIDSSGNVGIGTSSPSSYGLLSVLSSTNSPQIWAIGSSNNAGIAIVNTGTGGNTWSLTSTNNSAGVGGGKLRIAYAASSTWGTTDAVVLDGSGNVGIGISSFGNSAAKVIGISNGTAPTTSPAGMGQLYVESGALKYRGSSGTVTTIANA